MNSSSPRVIETSISRDTVVSQVSAFLYSIGVVHDNEDIKNIQFGELFGKSETELVPIKIFINKRQQEVSLIKHNGGTT